MRKLFQLIDELGSIFLFLIKLFQVMHLRSLKKQKILEQIYQITLYSLPIVIIAGFFVGALMSLQFAVQVQQFGAMSYLGGLAASSIVREVGPLYIAFMLGGRIGAFTTAELGAMRVTQQIDAIECLGSHPIGDIIWPRFLGIIAAGFFLLFVGLVMSLFGGMLLSFFVFDLSHEEYIRHIPLVVQWPSIVSMLYKCLVFSFVLATICIYNGYTVAGDARDVGHAVVHTAVATMIGLVIADSFTSLSMEAFISLSGYFF